MNNLFLIAALRQLSRRRVPELQVRKKPVLPDIYENYLFMHIISIHELMKNNNLEI